MRSALAYTCILFCVIWKIVGILKNLLLRNFKNLTVHNFVLVPVGKVIHIIVFDFLICFNRYEFFI